MLVPTVFVGLLVAMLYICVVAVGEKIQKQKLNIQQI